MIKILLKHVVAAAALGALVGLLVFALLAAFEEAFAVARAMNSLRGRGGPGFLILLVGCAGGWGGHRWFQHASGLAGLAIVSGLALLAALTALAVSTVLGTHHTALDPDHVLGITLVPVVGLMLTACILEWMDQ
ncbi:MAG: hypothetical protein AB7G11_03475 [Phycisphaerales bacterium]